MDIEINKEKFIGQPYKLQVDNTSCYIVAKITKISEFLFVNKKYDQKINEMFNIAVIFRSRKLGDLKIQFAK